MTDDEILEAAAKILRGRAKKPNGLGAKIIENILLDQAQKIRMERT